ncbi:MAG: HEAT repeat domain-containing protein [Deltaproteobacteria bacterium]|nr:HEAT repeat domain-containing protein [Deltaproteobacteria bacterium]
MQNPEDIAAAAAVTSLNSNADIGDDMKVVKTGRIGILVALFASIPLLLSNTTKSWSKELFELASVNTPVMKPVNTLSEDLAVYELIENLKSADITTKLDAALALGKMKTRRSVSSLIHLLKESREGVVRFVAATSLGEIGDRRAVMPLIDTIQDNKTKATVLIAVARALGKIKDSRAVDPLIKLLWHEDPDVRAWMADALGQLHDLRAVMALIATLGDENPRVRTSAARALGETKDILAVDSLIVVFKEDRVSDVRWWAAHALGDIGDPRAVGSLVEIIKVSDPEDLGPLDDVLALKYLEPSGGPPMEGFIKGMQWSIQVEAIRSLGKMGEEALPPLTCTLLKHPDFDFRTEAAKMIIEIRGTLYMVHLLKYDDSLLFVKTLYEYVISQGEVGTEGLLINALEAYGEIHMARDFLGSENEKLLKGAVNWMDSNGYKLPAKKPKGGPRWGKKI